MIDYRPISVLSFFWKEEKISRITWNRATRPPSMHGATMVHANRNRACAIKKEAMQPIKKETAIIKDNTNHKRHVSMAHQSLLSSRLKRLKSGHRFGATIQCRSVGLPSWSHALTYDQTAFTRRKRSWKKSQIAQSNRKEGNGRPSGRN